MLLDVIVDQAKIMVVVRGEFPRPQRHRLRQRPQVRGMMGVYELSVRWCHGQARMNKVTIYVDNLCTNNKTASMGGFGILQSVDLAHLFDGAGTRSRTRDLLITSQLLYQLSYAGISTLAIYVGLAGVAGFEPAHADTKNQCLTAWLYPSIVVARDGIEPPTRGFSIHCSTD